MRRIWNRLVRGARDESGFTLIELLVVLVILAAISAIAIPRVATTRTNAKQTVHTANKAILQNAVERYHLEKEDWPTTSGAVGAALSPSKLVPDYLAKDLELGTNLSIDDFSLDANGILTP